MTSETGRPGEAGGGSPQDDFHEVGQGSPGQDRSASAPADRWSDTGVELLIAGLLRAGVAISGLIVFAGGLLALLQHGGEPRPDLSTYEEGADGVLSLGELLRGVASLDPTALIQLGLVILVATPVLRVAVSGYAFVRQRDWIYVVISLTVLTVLAYGLLGGIA